MSDNRRVYRTIRQAIMQLYPGEPKSNTMRMLTTLAALVSGIVLGKSCQLPTIAWKAPDRAKLDSRFKRYSRWIQNERIGTKATTCPLSRSCSTDWQRSANWCLSSMAAMWGKAALL